MDWTRSGHPTIPYLRGGGRAIPDDIVLTPHLSKTLPTTVLHREKRARVKKETKR